MKQMQVAQLLEQATENRCIGGSIPPLVPLYEINLLNFLLFYLLYRRVKSIIILFHFPLEINGYIL